MKTLVAVVSAGLIVYAATRWSTAHAYQIDRAERDIGVAPGFEEGSPFYFPMPQWLFDDPPPTPIEFAPSLSVREEAEYVNEPEVDVMRRRLVAFLYMIRCCEHRQEDVETGLCYFTYYGGSVFGDMSDHPVITGEKLGVRLAPEMCRKAGFSDGKCVTTAAGAYQMIKKRWQTLRAADTARDWLYLSSFEPMEQDIAATRSLELLGALPLIEAGDINGAIKKCAGEWASLPGNNYGQHPKTIDQAMSYYDRGLELYDMGELA